MIDDSIAWKDELSGVELSDVELSDRLRITANDGRFDPPITIQFVLVPERDIPRLRRRVQPRHGIGGGS